MLGSKAKEVPALQRSIETGALSISKIKPVLAVLTTENSEHWIEQAKSLPRAAIEKEVAAASPQPKKREKLHYVRKEALRLHLEVSEALSQKLKRAQELSGSGNWEETLGVMVEHYLKTKDPVAKSKRALERSLRLGEKVQKHDEGKAPLKELPADSFQGLPSEKQEAETLPGESRRRKALSAKVKHAVNLRDAGRCQFKGVQGSCRETRFIEIHHRVPVARGGGNTLENLISLCHRHHDLAHLHQPKYLAQKGMAGLSAKQSPHPNRL